MFRTSLLVICVVLAASTFSEAGSTIQTRRTPRIVQSGPPNAAAHVGSDVILSCQTTPGDRTQWIEFITSSDPGGIISDNGTVSGAYPRYFMNNDHSEGWYNLTISPVQLEDGGRFRCRDEITLDFADAEVVVQDPVISCTNTIQSNNVIILGVYYMMNCVVTFSGSAYVAPSTRWTGPGDFNAGQANGTDVNGTRVIQSGVSFIAQKNQDGQRFTMQTYYEPRYFGTTPGSPSNVPDLTNSVNGPFMFVQYGPWNISYTPVNPTYEINQVVTCQADARPLPTYRWINMQTAAIVQSQTLVLDASMVGTYTWRCEVVNSWGTQNIFTNITVNPITTPTPSTPSTTTTPVPPVSNCNDLSGKWSSTRGDGTTIALCLYVDTTQNGAVSGYLQNNTNIGTLIILAGQTRNQIFDETGLVGIWQDDTGVSALAVECHNCYGVEQLIVNVVSRTEQDDVSCGDGGTLRNSEQYTFSRGPWDTSSGFCYE